MEIVNVPQTALVHPVRRNGPRESAKENTEVAEISSLSDKVADALEAHGANRAASGDSIAALLATAVLSRTKTAGPLEKMGR